MFEINGKVALVTGALGGIGRSYVKSLLKNKLKLAVLVDIDEEAAGDFLEELGKDYGDNCAWFIKTDVSDFAQLEDAFKKTVERVGQLDIVINNAGLSDANVLKCAQVNFVSVVIGTNLAFEKYLPKYKKGEEGVVVNTASITGLKSFDFAPIYSATKQGVIALGRSLGNANHYCKDKIKIITICPGVTDTPMLKEAKNISRDFLMSSSYGSIHRKQTPECVGEALIKTLEEGGTGSVWIVDDTKPAREIEFEKVDEIMLKQILDKN